MKVLITGGTGYLGRAIVAAFARRGHEPVVLARTASRSGLPATLVDGDVREASSVQRAATGCDAICHAAALVSIWRRRREDFDDVNVGGLRNVLDAGAALGIRRIIYTSSFLALPPHGGTDPIEANDYQRTKVAAARLAEARAREGSPLIRVYPGVIYGPGASTEGNLIGRMIADHLRGRLPGLVGADRPWSFAYIDDVARGHCEAVERGRIGAQYVLGGENASQRQMFAVVQQITGRRPPRDIPLPVASALGAIEEWRARLFGATPLLTRGTVEIFRHDWSLDSQTASRELGYTVTPLADGLRRTIEALGS